MQCASCRFENMPGTRNCARCGSSMELSSQAIDVHPPRARKWVKPARRFSRTRYAVSNRVGAALDRVQRIRLDSSGNAPPLTLDLVIRLLLPGWAQFHLRRPGRGYVFSIGAGICFALALLLVGTGWGSLAMGTLFSIHAASISDAIVAPGSSIRESIANGIMVYVVLGVLIYLPALWLIGRVVVPYNIQQNIAPFQEGDVLLIHPGSHWKRGEVVVYMRNRGERLTLPPLGHERRILELNGTGIDRILAGPGEHIRSSHGVLTVNDVPVKDRPLTGGLPNFDVSVPPDSYFIWPSIGAMYGGGEQLTNVSLVPRENISGKVIFRSYPWSRFGVVH